MVKTILPFIASLTVAAVCIGGAGAQQVPPAALPAGAVLLAHAVSVHPHPCAAKQTAACRGVVTVDIYKLPGPTSPPPGAVVPNVRAQIAAEQRALVRRSAVEGGLRSLARLGSGCTGCGSW